MAFLRCQGFGKILGVWISLFIYTELSTAPIFLAKKSCFAFGLLKMAEVTRGIDEPGAEKWEKFAKISYIFPRRKQGS